MENVPQNDKLSKFLDYFVEQQMANQNFPIEIWNINTHRNRTNNAIQGWNSKVHSIIGKQQPTFFFAGTEIKRRSRVGILATEIKETWKPGQTKNE
jgi:hypothetical protein